MSIGNALAEARRQSGLTVTEVSQRTCIRETIIRGIERSDFSACGGDFYARGHIRSIATVVGADPEPIIREYDATQGAPQAISAADVFQSVTPVKMRERRRPNWTAAMALALVLVAGIFAYQHFAARSATTVTRTSDAVGTSAKPKSGHQVRAQQTAHHSRRRLTIRLAATQDCWVQLRTATGQTIFSGTVYAGSTMNWTEHRAVSMIIGNPAGVTLRVNGKNPVPRGAVSTVTLSLRAGLDRHQPGG
ncbi:MAG TPA: RodZ domain-containing protein [Streptosporangiaceae bacterium]|nr:RodZ domain-containing protein [Streptosporangiaceae bacterium]